MTADMWPHVAMKSYRSHSCDLKIIDRGSAIEDPA